MLYCTSLLATVAQGEEIGSSPRKLKIINTKTKSTICDLIFPLTILQVKLTNTRLIVVLEDQIYLYDITTMKLLHTIETSLTSVGYLLSRTMTPTAISHTRHHRKQLPTTLYWPQVLTQMAAAIPHKIIFHL